MPFIERFELLNLVHYDVVETWATRESGSGRPLLLHRYPKTSGLRERLQSMPLEELAMILKAGEDGDYFFVVTQDTPDFRRFMDWVARFSAPEPAEAAPLVLEDSVLDEPAKPAEPGEFTQMFRTANPPPPPPAVAEQRQKPAAEPGEFTRMFKGPAAPPQRPAPAAPLTQPAVGREPGEFTRSFKSPLPETLPANPKARPPLPDPGPGEFTQMFGRPNQSAPPQKTAAEPGELTRLFKGPAVPPQRPALPPGGQQPGEFTKLFNNPLPETPLAARLENPQAQEKPAASFNEPGDFTNMFGRPGQHSADRSAPANLSSADRPADLGAATGIFSKRNIFESASPQAPLTAGPGEYTRMFQPGGAAEGATNSAPAQTEQKPPAPPPPAPKKQAQSTPIALIVILAVIAVVAIGLILYFVMKR